MNASAGVVSSLQRQARGKISTIRTPPATFSTVIVPLILANAGSTALAPAVQPPATGEVLAAREVRAPLHGAWCFQDPAWRRVTVSLR